MTSCEQHVTQITFKLKALLVKTSSLFQPYKARLAAQKLKLNQ
ncbi:hypothetical protein AALB_2115 [Agarivorans albus MKT 106]|uniref:Uncharacterized protein n=1 Tax=Agarivorans albus MKT 106 TaxID=1331007 RepID=R9PL21_AGAAL|nr:hypothetical protein AALB_2115 [Agarivorans albus MKT 106]